MEKISIIVPVYNVEKYLKDCLSSILNQTFSNFELILVDDGSQDDSGKICDEFALKDNRIKVIHKENGGQSSARNIGLDIAKGEYIIFVDSDDVIATNMFEILFNIICETNTDIVTCKYIRFFLTTEISINENVNSNRVDILNTDTIMKELVNNEKVNFSPCAKIYKKELFNSLRFQEGIIFEDMQLLYQLWATIEKAAITDSILYFYRNNPTSTLNSKYNSKHLIEYEIRKDIYEFYQKDYPKYSYNFYVNWMFSSVLMYVRITHNEYKNKSNYKYLLNFDKKILKKCNKKDLMASVKLSLRLYRICPYLLVLAFRIKYCL